MSAPKLKRIESRRSTAPDPKALCRRFQGRPGTEHWYVGLLGLNSDFNAPETIDASVLIRAVTKGLPFKSLTTLQQLMSLSLEEIADFTQIGCRTVSRRKERGRLASDESERLLRLARIFSRALELFEGDNESALQWLSTPKRALGGDTPLKMAKTEIGATEIERLIGRLEYGVFT